MTGVFGEAIMFAGSPEDAPRLFPAPECPVAARVEPAMPWWQVIIAGPAEGRRQLIMREAERLTDIATDCDKAEEPPAGPVMRDAYRDMAAALRLLADERGT